MQTVLEPKPVSETNVLILVSTPVARMQFVMLLIIFLSARVLLEWLAMLLSSAILWKVLFFHQIYQSFRKDKFERFVLKSCNLLEIMPVDPCNPSPCGVNSLCRKSNGVAVCTCVAGYLGSPPNCRPECTISSDCPQNQACTNQKCADPCLGTCGVRASCNVVNHNPICSCMSGMTGDPFVFCTPMSKFYMTVRCWQFLNFLITA